MNLIKASIERPIAVIAAVLMVVMFGLVALQSIPIQLAPDVNRPVITVRTFWPGAAPAEVERNIINRQEEVLKGLESVETISSSSSQGSASVTLEFKIGTNMDRALLLVSNRLDQVTGYPEEADEPSLNTAGSEDSPIAWFIVTRAEGNERPIYEYGDFLEDVVKERIERVAGISEVDIYGEASQEIEIIVEPELLARYGMTVSEVVTALRRANASVSAGNVDEGKRRYVVRTEGELDTVAKINDVVVRSDSGGAAGRLARVTIGDIAEVRFGYTDPSSSIRMLGQQAIALPAKRETGANVIETMRGVREAVDELKRTVIPEMGLELKQVYDETVYIDSSIDLVQQNIWVGGALAALILLIFLRSPRATLVISVAIPVSVIGSFVAMAALGRSINVISLAGLAFAVGMVVDAAIVVLENIYRMRESGKPTAVAAYQGAQQVWGAILVSALTTVMVFIPILVMQLEVGQLFRDIAVAISVSVLLSLVVSITVLPALANRLLGGAAHRKEPDVSRMPLPGIDHFASAFVALVLGFTRGVVRNPAVAFLVVAVVTGGASFAAWKFLPELEYLPEGNRNLVFGRLIPPPGYNLETTTDIAQTIEAATRPLWASETGAESEEGQPPKMERFFFVARRDFTFIGAVSVDPQRAGELVPILRDLTRKEPGTFGFVSQPSLFGRGIGGGRKIELDITGPDLETILGVAQRATAKMLTVLPLRRRPPVQADGPAWNLGAPEVRVIPDRVRLADNGITARELGEAVDTFNDGLRVAEITVGNKRVDMMLQGPDRERHRNPGHRQSACGHLGRSDHSCYFTRRRHSDQRSNRKSVTGKTSGPSHLSYAPHPTCLWRPRWK